MSRRAAVYLGAVVCLAILTVWAFVHGASRRDDDVPDAVQPWDERTVTLASGHDWRVANWRQQEADREAMQRTYG